MRHFVRVAAFVLAATGLAGCRTSTPVAMPDVPSSAPRPVPNLTQVKPKSLEPDSKSLPLIDALIVQPHPIFAEGAGPFLGLTREQCWSLAVQVAAGATLLEQENTIPDCQPANRKGPDPCRESVLAFVKQVRTLAAMGERNKAAAEALERFYQLADVEGRVEQLHLGMEVLDSYRALVKRTDPGAIPPEFRVKLDDLNTQRSRSVELLFKAESGEYQLNLDLKRRLGMPGGTADRFWPRRGFLHQGRTARFRIAGQSRPGTPPRPANAPARVPRAFAGHPADRKRPPPRGRPDVGPGADRRNVDPPAPDHLRRQPLDFAASLSGPVSRPRSGNPEATALRSDRGEGTGDGGRDSLPGQYTQGSNESGRTRPLETQRSE